VFSTKTGAAKLLIAVVVGLIVLKVLVSWLTGSISILAQTADSLLDLIAGIITFSAIRIATKPPDEEHPYGHGKIEDIAAVIQGILIFVVGGLIIYTSIGRIIRGTQIELAEAGAAMMLISIVTSILLSHHLMKVSRATGSIALEANARNIAADVYSALAVLIGLVVVRITGFATVDSIIAIGVAIYILKIGYDTIRKPISGLIDTKLPRSQESLIKTCLMDHNHEVVGFHALRTRRAGSQHYIDLHLVMAKDMQLEQAHEVCDQIETEIQSRLPESSVNIHIEPCNDECQRCFVICSIRKKD
jgi:cation diffusion facilitator family transporter